LNRSRTRNERNEKRTKRSKRRLVVQARLPRVDPMVPKLFRLGSGDLFVREEQTIKHGQTRPIAKTANERGIWTGRLTKERRPHREGVERRGEGGGTRREGRREGKKREGST